MATKTTYTLGALLITLLISGVVYVTFPDANVKLRIDEDKSTFYVIEDSRWVVSGREYNSLFEGTTKMNRRSSGITINITTDYDNNQTTIKRVTPYIRGPIIIDTYTFDGQNTDVELFPIKHIVEIINGSDLLYRYEVKDLDYNGSRKKLYDISMSFGKNMKVAWQKDYRWAWVYADGILKVQYDILSDYQKFEVRLFDPLDVLVEKDGFSQVTECETIDYFEKVITYHNYSIPCNDINGTCKEPFYIITTRNSSLVPAQREECKLVEKYSFTVNKSAEEKDFTAFGACKVDGNTLICDSRDDGNADGVCQSGETCVTYELDNGSLTVTEDKDALDFVKNKIPVVSMAVAK